MSQLVANLVENALTHTPAGAHVRVEVDAAQARISVTDDGPGVPTAMLTRVFRALRASRRQPFDAWNRAGARRQRRHRDRVGGRLYAKTRARASG